MTMKSEFSWSSNEQYRNNHRLAIRHLGKLLFRGELVLILGAGVSVPFGLASWTTLLQECADDIGVSLSDLNINTKKGALLAASRIKAGAASVDDYHSLVQKILYKKHKRYTPTPLFSAVTAMLSGAARGKVSTVLTLNFDDLLETFLLLHGYDCQVVSSLPSLTRAADVIIYHPHGFLPKNGGMADKFFQQSEKIIFSKDEFSEILSKKKSEWRKVLQTIVHQKVVLAVGLGAGEPHLKSLFSEVVSNVRDRPLGFWLSKRAVGGTEMRNIEERFYRESNLIPIVLDNYEPDYENFISGICRAAADQYRSSL